MDLHVTGVWKAGFDLMKQVLSLCPGQDLNPAPLENEYSNYQAKRYPEPQDSGTRHYDLTHALHLEPLSMALTIK